MKIGWLLCVAASFFSISALFAHAESVDYLHDVKPILRDRCYACHGALEQKAGLRLDTAALILGGGDGGPSIQPGSPDQSLLMERITEADESLRMPLDSDPLSGEQIAVLKAWIEQGAPAPADEQPQQDPRHHWAFVPPVRPSIPPQSSPSSADNPIDVLIGLQQQQRGLSPVPLADRAILLRRVYLDLVGLAPTRDQLHAFLDATAEDAFTRVVDRLLASPRYGERWGRHWMDVWRYSDAYGALGQRSQKHIWNWRDWIIESLNRDQGYDRMVTEMLAADEVAPTDREAMRATGFVARNYFHFNRDVWLDNTVEHTSKAFLGLTLNCCRCHDHKFDPIAQREYYALRAVFEPHRVRLEQLGGESDGAERLIPRVFDADSDVPTWLYESGNAKRPQTEAPVPPNAPGFFEFAHLAIEPIRLPGTAYYPALRPLVIDEMLAGARRAVTEEEEKASAVPTPMAKKQLARAQAALASLESRIAAEQARHVHRDSNAEVLARAAVDAEQAYVRLDAELKVLEAEQGLSTAREALKAGKEKARASVIAAETRLSEGWARFDATQSAEAEEKIPYSNLGKIFADTSSGRRLALARWITHPRNPLTARVAVNHLWLRHFGNPLVPTVFDFGRNGSPPSHPALLDWLAVDFIEYGWSMKRLHRMIVTSRAYRRSSSSKTAGAETLAADPDNRWLWRANPQRMESQIIRDNVFYLCGQLDCRLGGADIETKEVEAIARRSIYFHHSEKERATFLAIFDDANVNECYRREETVVPQQALAMANSRFVLARSRQLAHTLSILSNGSASAVSDVEFITAAFETLLSRGPTEAERKACQSALANMQQSLADQDQAEPSKRAREYLVHVLFNHNDFVTVR